MTTLLWWLAVNTATAAVLIPVVLAAGRLFRRRPAVRHLLWAIVVLKLVTPPVVPWAAVGSTESVTEAPAEREEIAAAPGDFQLSDSWRAGGVSPLSDGEAQGADAPRSPLISPARTDDARLAVSMGFAVWLLGGAAWLALQFRRIARHRNVVRMASAAPDDLLAEVRAVAARLGVSAPKTLLARGISSPFVWCVGRPTLVWPAGLNGAEARGIIAHELAHLRRGDHWVAWLELAAGAIWWWNPLFRFAHRRMREAAEMACDALAIHTAPDDRRGYAELLLRLSAGFPPASPAPVPRPRRRRRLFFLL